MDKKKHTPAKAPAATPPPNQPTPEPAPAHTPPLFRKIDWLAFGITTLLVWFGYYWTLAPDLTLEDSGELAVASLYAGIPHPPGYPVWTVYTWLWANFLPFNNIAWRVALGEATAGAIACGLLGLLVSRGSSMLMEGITDLKSIGQRWENAICVVSGFVAGLLLGFNGYMWSQSVIVEVYSFSVLSLVAVLLFLLRWVYAPHQNRYLYLAFFMYGICVNNHQSLLPIAMGIEALIIAVKPRLGREFLFWNVVIYLLLLAMGPSLLIGNPMVFLFFNVVGIGSAAGWTWISVREKREISGYIGGGGVVLSALLFLVVSPPQTALPLMGLSGLVLLRLYSAYDALFQDKARIAWHWLATMISGVAFSVGMAFYLYMALAGMSNPPMQWGYPRTVEGFVHAFTRGQYEKISPTKGVGDNFIDQASSFITTYSKQMLMYFDGLDNEFNLVCVLIAIGVFLFYRQMQKRERSWIIGLVGIFVCLGPMLVFLLNPPPDRQARELIRVFFTASHVVISIGVGYGLALFASFLATHYRSIRRMALMGGIVAVDLALFALAVETYSQLGSAPTSGQELFLNGLVRFGFVALSATCIVMTVFRLIRTSETLNAEMKPLLALSGIGLACLLVTVVLFRSPETGVDPLSMIGFVKLISVLVAAVCLFFSTHQCQPSDRTVFRAVAGLTMLLSLSLTFVAVFGNSLNPVGLATFFKTLATAFAPGQFAMPVLANLLLLGLAVAFLAGIALWRTRAPLALTLLVFAVVPLQSYMAHWADNEQRGHLFGYWFGHDMFTPPFEGKDGKPIYPEMARDAILYGGTDPGRFCPTYMIFCESFIPPEAKKNTDPNFDRRDVYIITQNALADGTYLNYIRAHYDRSAQKKRGLDTPFFQELFRSTEEREKRWETNWLARAVQPLDRFFTSIGESIEKDRRAGSSLFKESDFLDLNSLAAKLRQPTNGIEQQLAGELSPETRTLLTSSDPNALARALAKDFNRIIEKGLYDDSAMATNITLRWDATFKWEALVDERQHAAQLGPVAMQRAAAAENQAKQQLDRIKAELAKQADQVEAQLTEAGIPLTPRLKAFILQAPQSSTRIRLARQLLEAAFPKDITVSPGGVYPDLEMHIASPQESQLCFQEYLSDAQRRLQNNQLKPGEDVKIVDNKVQVSGQVAVMAINGLLTKVMFDMNPNNEFYVEESFPLDWMYPHLTPSGVIMKINRQPLKTLPEEVFEKDHDFWSQYSERLIGNWITYDTPVSNIVQFVEKVYLRHDWSGLTEGQRKFARDDQGQKAFSKLRSSIGGVFAWRIDPIKPPPVEYRPKTEAEIRRIYKEADFTFKQAFAFCPYSPEAVFRYINLLVQPPAPIAPRLNDALLIAETAQKLDPYNTAIAGLIGNLRDWKKRVGATDTQKLEEQVRANPADFAAALNLAFQYLQVQQMDRAYALIDGIVSNPKVDAPTLMTIVEWYRQLNNVPRMEAIMTRMIQLQPQSAEAWYDLASIRTSMGRPAEGMMALSNALTISVARRATNPTAIDLVAEARKDARLAPLQPLPEFQKLVPQ